MDCFHTPVLLKEVASFIPATAEVMVDFTLGGAGHAASLLKQNRKLFLYGVDQDKEALEIAQKNLSGFQGRFLLINSSFSSAVQKLLKDGTRADFILADLGISSYQVENEQRGFSFRRDGPLDMRMNLRNSTTAADIVNNLTEPELSQIIRKYGEEPFARRISRKIIIARKKKALVTTAELKKCILDAIPKKFQHSRIHPATKTFQAIRIKVNHELKELEDLLKNSMELLNCGGRLAIIAFHSLEDRPVKQIFRKWEHPCLCPPHLPFCICGLKPIGKVLSRKTIRASQSEIEMNPRSRSARLRVVEKL